MDLEILKTQNAGYKTVNIDGILFLINDGSDELGYHYRDNVKFDTAEFKTLLTGRKAKYPNYLFVVVPDKSVILQRFLGARLMQNKCGRPHVDALSDLDFVIDPREHIIQTCEEHNSISYQPADTHMNELGLYSVYACVIRKLNLQPVAVDINYQSSESGDLADPLNNGTRDNLGTIESLTLPVLRLASAIKYQRWQIIDVSRSDVDNESNALHYSNDQIKQCQFAGMRAKFDIDYFRNDAAHNELKVLFFHDSNLSSQLIKECFAAHFKHCYFRWSSFNEEMINAIKPDFVIEVIMERFINSYRVRISPQPAVRDGELYKPLSEAAKLLRTGKFAEAAEVYQAVLKIGPQKQAHAGLLRIALRTKRWEEGFQRAELALADFPDSRTLTKLQGQLFLEAGCIDEAERVYNTLVKKYPNHPSGFTGLAIVAVRRKEWPLAVERWRGCRESFLNQSKHVRGMWGAAEAHARLALDQVDEVETLYKSIAEDLPLYAPPFAGLARVAARRGDWALALERWEYCIQRFPGHPNVRLWRKNANSIAVGRQKSAVA